MYVSKSSVGEHNFLLAEYIQSFKKIAVLIVDKPNNPSAFNDFKIAFESLIDADYPNLDFYFYYNSDFISEVSNYKIEILSNYSTLLNYDFVFIINKMISVKQNFFSKLLSKIGDYDEEMLLMFNHKKVNGNSVCLLRNFLIFKGLLKKNHDINSLLNMISYKYNNNSYALLSGIFTYDMNYFSFDWKNVNSNSKK